MENKDRIIEAVITMVMTANVDMIKKLEREVETQSKIIENLKGEITFWQHLSWALLTILVIALIVR